MEKIFIKNRKDQNIAVLVDIAPNQQGLVFIMHGLSGFKEQEHLVANAEAFEQKGFTVVRFDTTNTFGESDGSFEKATVTNYYEDLEDVIAWSKKQTWFQEPFVLTGHSLGGMCVALYSEAHPQEILALAPISPVISGQLSMATHKKFKPVELANWEKTGWKESPMTSKPGILKRLPWSHMTDRLKYDLLSKAEQLTMPVLLITGENDTSTPPSDVQMLYEALPGPKEFHIIKNGPHTFRDPSHLQEIKSLLLHWIDTLISKS